MAGWMETVACIRAVVFQEAGAFSAQCLDYDIAAQSQSLIELHEELARVLAVHVAASCDLKQEPFSRVAPAPLRFWEAYETGCRIETKPVTFSLSNGRPSMPPIRADMRLARSLAA
jgi:hypothetical protein